MILYQHSNNNVTILYRYFLRDYYVDLATIYNIEFVLFSLFMISSFNYSLFFVLVDEVVVLCHYDGNLRREQKDPMYIGVGDCCLEVTFHYLES